jgi:hypothetical protein
LNFETLKTIAAFGGITLGIANLAITIYDKFLKRGKVSIEIEAPYVKLLDTDWYVFQMKVAFISKVKENWIKQEFKR